MRTAQSRQAGYTLLEVLVVLGLMAMITAVSMPLLRGGADTGLIERTASRLAADLTTTRIAAIKQNIETHLDIDVAANSYSGTPHLSPRPLPPAVPIHVTADTGRASSSTVASIRFFPDGGSAGGRIMIGAGNQCRIITIDRLTGLIRIRRGP